MSTFAVAALAAVLLASAVASAALAIRSRRPSIATVREVLSGAGPVDRRSAAAAGVRSSRSSSWSEALADGPLGRRARGTFGPGLAVVDLTVHDVVTRVAMGAIGCGGAVVLSCGGLVALGSLPASPWWVLVAVVAAAAGGVTMWSDTATKVERGRRRLDRAINDLVQLVAVGLTTDQSVDEAVSFALTFGDSPAAALVRDEVLTAPLRGVQVWEALDALGRRFDHPVLGELAASVERQGTHGVSITRTVASIAAAQRARALDELEREADRANANLAGPTVCFVVTTVVFLAYPLAMRISEAFGG